VPTAAEMLQQDGIATVTAGTKPVVFLHDRDKHKTSAAGTNSVLLYASKTIPRSAEEACVKANDDKPFPAAANPNSPRDNWTTKALLNSLWKKTVPKYSLLWLSEPDATQHADGIGHTNSIAAIENSDRLLGEVLKKLEEKKVKDETDILVVSDHGFSTILKGQDVAEVLKKAKFHAARKHEDPEKGDVLVVGLGGSSCFYVYEHDETVIRRLVQFLQTTDFAGVIFSRVPVEGTFPLDAVRLSTTNVAPDVVVSFRWFADRNDNGAPGLLISDGGTKGKGTHASLCRYDMLNTGVAWGPDFKKGHVSDVPSGNIDITPTVLHILGVKPKTPLDGRVLTEALANGGPAPTAETKTLEATRETGIFRWKQYLKYSQVGNAIYFDEGNGEPAWR
jgi:arylsulfatase A-like enzyme